VLKIIDRYLLKSVSQGVLLAVLIFLSLDVLIAIIGEMDDIGRGDYGVADAFYFVLLTIPRRVYDMFAVSAVVGVLLGLGALAAGSELTVLRSVGYSRLRIAAAVVMAMLLWMVPVAWLGEFVVPNSEFLAESFRTGQLQKNVGISRHSGIWVRDGQVILNALPVREKKNGTPQVKLVDVTIYQLDGDLQVKEISQAREARHEGSAWRMKDVRTTRFTANKVVLEESPEKIWPSRIDPKILTISRTRPKYLSARDIIRLQHFKRNQAYVAPAYRIALWAKLAFPLLVIASALSGLPFLFGSVRGGLGQRLTIGVMIGVVLYLINRTLLNLGEVYALHPFWVTVLPPLLIILGVLWYLRPGRLGDPGACLPQAVSVSG